MIRSKGFQDNIKLINMINMIGHIIYIKSLKKTFKMFKVLTPCCEPSQVFGMIGILKTKGLGKKNCKIIGFKKQ